MVTPLPLSTIGDNEGQPVTDKTLLLVVTDNYEICITNSDRLNALQGWARKPK